MPSIGEQAPAFKVKAGVTGREVSPQALAGRRAVLVLHGPRTTDAPKAVGKAVRGAVASADDAWVANIVNLKSMAGLWKKVADAQIKATYEKMAAKITAGEPEDYVIICPDYEDSVARALGLDDTNKTAAVVVLEDDGTVLGVHQGPDTELAEKAVGWVS